VSGASEPRRTLTWDGTVTAGNLLTATTLLLGLLVWGLRLEGRVDRQEERQGRFEQLSAQHRTEDRQAELAALAELRQALRRIEDILLQQARETRRQGG
jgi:Tfp pilus assembly protein PilO